LDELTNKEEAAAKFDLLSGGSQVPKIFHDGVYIGGFTQLKTLFDTDQITSKCPIPAPPPE